MNTTDRIRSNLNCTNCGSVLCQIPPLRGWFHDDDKGTIWCERPKAANGDRLDARPPTNAPPE